MKIIKIGLLTAVFIICIHSLQAGESGFRFLRVGVPAKGAGLGDSYISQFGDVNTVVYNPAGVAQLDHKQLAAGYMNHIMDIGSGYGVYAQPFKDRGVFGISVVYFNYGKFDGYDANGYNAKQFSAGDYAVSLFHAHRIKENFYQGAALKFVRSSIGEYSAGAIALDLGVIYLLPDDGIQLGASILNAGIVTDAFLNRKEKLPLSFQIGASRKWKLTTFSLNFSDLNVPGNRLERFALSSETALWEKIFFRAGYNNQRRSELDQSGTGFMKHASGFSAGIGVKFKEYVIDYSFSSWGIAAVNRFSLTVNL
jgi:hypothetical protein